MFPQGGEKAFNSFCRHRSLLFCNEFLFIKLSWILFNWSKQNKNDQFCEENVEIRKSKRKETAKPFKNCDWFVLHENMIDYIPINIYKFQ